MVTRQSHVVAIDNKIICNINTNRYYTILINQQGESNVVFQGFRDTMKHLQLKLVYMRKSNKLNILDPMNKGQITANDLSEFVTNMRQSIGLIKKRIC